MVTLMVRLMVKLNSEFNGDNDDIYVVAYGSYSFAILY